MRRKLLVPAAAVLAAVFCLCMAAPALLQPAAPTLPQPTALPTASAAPSARPTAAPSEYRAVWVSYLEWQATDFTSAAAYRADLEDMLGNIAALGANVVIAQVRPFGDALYPSVYYPFSHLCTGTQGQDPGFDPLGLLVAAAHAHGLQVEAWCNPYRLQINGTPALCAASPATLYPDWVKEVDGDLYLDPADPDVRQYIADAVTELCANYALDGIHFDDYFYPDPAPTFDAERYAAYCATADAPLPLDAWRCGNVNALLQLCHAAAAAYGVRFGVAPQGDPALARATQYSDAATWLATPGYADYVMPQLYWGQHYTKSGSDRLALGKLAAQWAALPRCTAVALYFGLGAYRIGEGDGGDAPDEWQSGHALADAAALLRRFCGGVALYRYGSLYGNTAWQAFAQSECTALHTFWAANSA